MTKAEKLLQKRKKFKDKAEKIIYNLNYKEACLDNSLIFKNNEDRNIPYIKMVYNYKNELSLILDNKVLASGVQEIREFRDWLTDMVTDSTIATMREIKQRDTD